MAKNFVSEMVPIAYGSEWSCERICYPRERLDDLQKLGQA